MKFELKEYKRELTDDEILDDIKSVAEKLGKDYLPLDTYKKNGKYSQCAIQNHFGSWKEALSKAGLRCERTAQELKRISDDDYFTDLRRVATLIDNMTVPYNEYIKHGQYSAEHIFKRFGEWDAFLLAAGLEPTGLARKRIEDQELLEDIERLWRALGRQPTTTDIEKGKLSKYSIDSYKRRFGGWRKALEAFVAYINESPNCNEEYSESKPTSETIQDFVESSVEDNAEEIRRSNHRTSRNVNTRLRFLVMKRDSFKCCICGASPAKDPSVELHVDHIIPWSKGGETVMDNLQTLCSRCNLGKSDLMD